MTRLRNNIGFGRRGSTQAEIEAAARIAHLHDFVVAQPEVIRLAWASAA